LEDKVQLLKRKIRSSEVFVYINVFVLFLFAYCGFSSNKDGRLIPAMLFYTLALFKFKEVLEVISNMKVFHKLLCLYREVEECKAEARMFIEKFETIFGRKKDKSSEDTK